MYWKVPGEHEVIWDCPVVGTYPPIPLSSHWLAPSFSANDPRGQLKQTLAPP